MTEPVTNSVKMNHYQLVKIIEKLKEISSQNEDWFQEAKKVETNLCSARSKYPGICLYHFLANP